jgi:hypothetical protein
VKTFDVFDADGKKTGTAVKRPNGCVSLIGWVAAIVTLMAVFIMIWHALFG